MMSTPAIRSRNPEELQTLMDLLERHSEQIGFDVATGRIIESAMDILNLNGVRMPDIIISGVGRRISYGNSLDHDKGWGTQFAWLCQSDKLSTMGFYFFAQPSFARNIF